MLLVSGGVIQRKHRIKYVAHYDTKNNYANRGYNLAAATKIDYICSAIRSIGCEVEIISPSETLNQTGYFPGGVRQLSDGVSLRNFATFGCKIKIFRILKHICSLAQLMIYLIMNTKKSELVLVYHSVILSFPVRIAKFVKRFKLVLEVEEIYQDVVSFPRILRKSEYGLFSAADKYLFSTELLNQKVNIGRKEFGVIYGTYETKLLRRKNTSDGKVHVVYAGTFDPRKGGALAAAAYLSKGYHMHIIGFGSAEEVLSIQNKIDETSKITQCTVTYDGLLSGDKYNFFLQGCDIGLSTQLPDAKFNNTSFPSKILSYMTNGLQVVSIRIPSVELSAIGKNVVYYDEQTPKAIAKAIMSVDISKSNENLELLKKLHEEFISKTASLLEM